MAPNGRICASILITFMEHKFIVENWRNFITEEEKDLSNLTDQERQALEDAIKDIKAYIIGAMAAEMNENLEEARPVTGERRRKRNARKKAKHKATLRWLIQKRILDQSDLSKQYDDLTDTQKTAYAQARTDMRFSDQSSLFSGDLLEKIPAIRNQPRLYNWLTALAGSENINLTTIMNSPLAPLFDLIM